MKLALQLQIVLADKQLRGASLPVHRLDCSAQLELAIAWVQ